MTGRRKGKQPTLHGDALPPLPARPVPTPTAADLALSAEISQRIADLAKQVVETNLLRTRRLVDMALRGQVPQDLITHFSMIGQDYYKLADNGPEQPKRRGLRVIDGEAE